MTLAQKAKKILDYIYGTKRKKCEFLSDGVNDGAPLEIQRLFKRAYNNLDTPLSDDHTYLEIVDALNRILCHDDKSVKDIFDSISPSIEPFSFFPQLLKWLGDSPRAEKYCATVLLENDMRGKSVQDVISLGNLLWRKEVLRITIGELEHYKYEQS